MARTIHIDRARLCAPAPSPEHAAAIAGVCSHGGHGYDGETCSDIPVTEPAAFAIYRSAEVTVRYFNGAGYVVRHEMYPHTTFTPGGPVTRQGHALLVGCRQGLGADGGFAVRRYARPDTDPFYVPGGAR